MPGAPVDTAAPGAISLAPPFIDVPGDLQRERFAAFYRWKRLDQGAIDALWDERVADEWPAIDAQREHADLVLAPKAAHS